MQRKACSCVEGSEWETRLQERFEDFFSVYDKTLLNRKGKLKDKKLWKSWRGRRPQMFYRLIMRFRDNDTVKLRSPRRPLPLFRQRQRRRAQGRTNGRRWTRR